VPSASAGAPQGPPSSTSTVVDSVGAVFAAAATSTNPPADRAGSTSTGSGQSSPPAEPATAVQTPVTPAPAQPTASAPTSTGPAPSGPSGPSQDGSQSSSSGLGTTTSSQAQPAPPAAAEAILAAVAAAQSKPSPANPAPISSNPSDIVVSASNGIASGGQLAGTNVASVSPAESDTKDGTTGSSHEPQPVPNIAMNPAPAGFAALGAAPSPQGDGAGQAFVAPAAIHANAPSGPDPGSLIAPPAVPAPSTLPAVAGTALHAPAPSTSGLPDQTQALLTIRLARAVQDGTPTLSVELHPAELGKVQVRLSFHDDGVGVQMTVDRRETFDAFTRDRLSLERQFSQAGIDLGSGGLDLRYGQQSGQPAPREAIATGRFTTVMQQPPSSGQPTRQAASNSLIDILA
jgi:flagellar hook-length control protein FliK